MAAKKIVVALGGNALGNTPEEQLAAVRKTTEIIADLALEGYHIVVGHGNGPQVGMINLAMDYSSCGEPGTPYIPLAECGAMSQGYIGYHLQQALQQSIRARALRREVVSVITQVLVDRDDPSFLRPSKPVGSFYTYQQAQELAQKKGFFFVEDSGRGYRRVVPSPQPQRIMELDAVRKMLHSGMIVITVGGGGIPVVQEGEQLRGVDAVVDKDKSCSRLAQDLDADTLLVLTAVDQVCINYNKPDQKPLWLLTAGEAGEYIRQGQFAPGSMLPKVEACLDFAASRQGRSAIITSLDKAREALGGNTGTRITA